jgi:hypothetical protein
MSTVLLELDARFTRLREQYLQEGDIDSVRELNSIIVINRTLIDANVNVLDVFSILLKRLEISIFANPLKEVFMNAYNVVNAEFFKYQQTTKQATLDSLSVFNFAEEFEKAKALTTQLIAVVKDVEARVDSKAPAVQLEAELAKAKAFNEQLKTVIEGIADRVGSKIFTAQLEETIETVATQLETVSSLNSNSPS